MTNVTVSWSVVVVGVVPNFLVSPTSLLADAPDWWKQIFCSHFRQALLLLDWLVSWWPVVAGYSHVKERDRADDKQTHGLDCFEGIRAGKKEVMDWSVQVPELLLLQWGYCDTETVLGFDWRRLVVIDKMCVAPGNEKGRRGAQVRWQELLCPLVDTLPS